MIQTQFYLYAMLPRRGISQGDLWTLLNYEALSKPPILAEFKSVIGVNAFIKFSLQAFRKLKNQNQRRVLFLNLHILHHLLFVALLQKSTSCHG